MKITKIAAFQFTMGNGDGWMPKSAFVRIETKDGQFGLGEASPMMGGYASLVIATHNDVRTDAQ